jgi:hypothetical protein
MLISSVKMPTFIFDVFVALIIETVTFWAVTVLWADSTVLKPLVASVCKTELCRFRKVTMGQKARETEGGK